MIQKEDKPRAYVIRCKPLAYGYVSTRIKIPASVCNIHSPEVIEFIISKIKKRYKKATEIQIEPGLDLEIPVTSKTLQAARSIPPITACVWGRSLKEAKSAAEYQWDLYRAHQKKEMGNQLSALAQQLQGVYSPIVNEQIEETRFSEETTDENIRRTVEKAFLALVEPTTENLLGGLLKTLTVISGAGGWSTQVVKTAPQVTAKDLHPMITYAIINSVLTVESSKQELAVQDSLGSKDGYLRSLPLKVNTDFLDNVKAAYDTHQISKVEKHIEIYQRGI